MWGAELDVNIVVWDRDTLETQLLLEAQEAQAVPKADRMATVTTRTNSSTQTLMPALVCCRGCERCAVLTGRGPRSSLRSYPLEVEYLMTVSWIITIKHPRCIKAAEGKCRLQLREQEPHPSLDGETLAILSDGSHRLGHSNSSCESERGASSCQCNHAALAACLSFYWYSPLSLSWQKTTLTRALEVGLRPGYPAEQEAIALQEPLQAFTPAIVDKLLRRAQVAECFAVAGLSFILGWFCGHMTALFTPAPRGSRQGTGCSQRQVANNKSIDQAGDNIRTASLRNAQQKTLPEDLTDRPSSRSGHCNLRCFLTGAAPAATTSNEDSDASGEC